MVSQQVKRFSQAYARVWLMVERQATALAYKDVVSMLAILVACLIPLTFIMKRPPRGGAAPPARTRAAQWRFVAYPLS